MEQSTHDTENKKVYESPAITYEADLEVRAGSPFGKEKVVLVRRADGRVVQVPESQIKWRSTRRPLIGKRDY